MDDDQKTYLSDHVYGQIFDLIASGQMTVGSQLPAEHELSEQMGVSRPVLRQALARLRADGLITSQKGAGSFVTHQPAARIRSFAAAQDIPGFLRCLEARITIESETARCAAERHTASQMKDILQAHAMCVQRMDNGFLCAEEDMAFHRAIAEASNNELYVAMLDGIQEAVLGFQKLVYNMKRTASMKRMRVSLLEHETIIDGIKSRDGQRAKVAMQYHLMQTRHRLMAMDVESGA